MAKLKNFSQFIDGDDTHGTQHFHIHSNDKGEWKVNQTGGNINPNTVTHHKDVHKSVAAAKTWINTKHSSKAKRVITVYTPEPRSRPKG